jgi:hypothetical protein
MYGNREVSGSAEGSSGLMVLYWFSPRRTEFRMNRVGIFGKPPKRSQTSALR